MMAVYGYARVSTQDQNPALQVDALQVAGVPPGNILVEHVSGAAKCRPAFARLLDRLQPGDTLTVWKVDRLGRSTVTALETAQQLDARGVRIELTYASKDPKTPPGRLVLALLRANPELARQLTR